MINRFAILCNELELTVTIKKTNLMGHDVPAVPSISTNNDWLVEDTSISVTSLYSTVSNNLSHNAEIDKRIG